ncbi:hypothetical protein AQUCO_05400024v1 [Aquilegia coerulea]|uniref:Major facilitator superfamily (MFS) profile domain-containing protein n=1 Tax=Aquilegia coerulea TaxID=218851 RepID=A0A2G5CHB0_AQUCA|nr:hypothetical protein AQUCO_05400024v1 [Aquilegia coerulea]
MGLVGLPENGNMSLSNLPLETKNKYRRMDENVTDDDIQHMQNNFSNNTKRFVIACAIFASLNTVLIGYDVGVMSGAILYIQEDLNLTEVQEEVLVGCLSIVSLLGSLAGGKASDAIGRKWTMGFAAIVFQAGAVVMALAPSFKVLLIGRLLAGVGIGFGVMIAPVYIAEISPAVARGSLTSYPEIFINIGILLGYVANYAFSGLPVHINWRVMLGVGILPSVFIGLSLFVIPESPRWLVMKNRIEEARIVLLKTNENQEEIEERLVAIQEAASKSNVESKYEEKAVWRELLTPSPTLRRMLITGIGIQCFQQITGIDATVYYSPTIFKEAGIEGNNKLLAATIAVGFSKTIFILIAIILIDRVGRKPLLYVSTIGMTACLFCLVLTLSLFANTQAGILLAIVLVCGNVGFFSVGIGPICWVVTSEIFPLKVRAQASALGSVVNRLCSGFITMSFLSICRAITVAGIFFVFALLAVLSIAFVHTYVPETKGKSLEQIELMFQKGEEQQIGEVELEDVEHLVQRE